MQVTSLARCKKEKKKKIKNRGASRGFRLVLKPSSSGYVRNSNNDLEKDKCIFYLYGHTVYACKYGTIPYYTERLANMSKIQKRIDSGAL